MAGSNFFKLFEEDLIVSFDEIENLVYTKSEVLINNVLNKCGLLGFIAIYFAMVLRKSKYNLAIFRNTLIIDIKSGLILNMPELSNETTHLTLERYHIPSLAIIKEIIFDYKKYKRNLLQYQIQLNKTEHNYFYSSADYKYDVEFKKNQRYPFQNKRYLFYLLHFYIHKSILLANSKKILINIKNVVTVREFTPKVLGYLSALYDLRVPLTLYLAIRSPNDQKSNTTLNMFNKIIAKNGIDADFAKCHADVPVYLEKKSRKEFKKMQKIEPNVGIFLASYYTMEINQLHEYISKTIIPFILRVKDEWVAKSVTIFCHPSDLRPKKILNDRNFLVNMSLARQAGRMLNYDLIICGNSSVAEEAFIEGIPVVYSGEIDTYEYDLYKYIKNGLAVDATYFLPTIEDIRIHYECQQNKDLINIFFDGAFAHDTVDFIEAITQN